MHLRLHVRSYLFLLLGILSWGVQPLVAQDAARPVELLVGTDPSSGSVIQETLEKGRMPGGADDSLFVGVQNVSRVVPASVSARMKRGTQPEGDFTAFRLTVRDSSALRRLRERWKRRPGVRYAHPNHEFAVHSRAEPPRRRRNGPVLTDQNPLADSLNHLGVVRALEGWSRTTGKERVRIGVIDTGFYLEHPDLSGQFWINEAEDVNGNGRFDPYPVASGGDLNGKDDDGNGFVDDVIGYDFVDRAAPILEGEYEDRDPNPAADPEGRNSAHGTAVAAVATASPAESAMGIAGVAPGTRLVALRAFGGDGRGQSDDIAAAIVYGATMGVDVLNLSFGRGRPVPLIEDAIEFANERGTIIVGSAGNELTDSPHYPSDYPSVLSVVWLAEDGAGLPQFNRSQFGIGVDIGAPGSNVFTADFPADRIQAGEPVESEDLYDRFSGSSFSAPQVAGAAALLRSADSSLSPASVRSILTGTSTDLEDENWDHTTGAGLLNVSGALGRAYPARTEIDDPGHNAGLTETGTISVIGSAVHPSFDHFSLHYAKGTRNLDTRSDPWNEITSPTPTQVLRDTLGRWNLSGLDEGSYTLRLVTRLQDGQTIEDRRRVVIDRTAPEIDVEFVGVGRVEGEHGVIADLRTDDRTRMTMTVRQGTGEATVKSEYETRRHGLTWADTRGRGGSTEIHVRATNRSGLSTVADTTLVLPSDDENTGLFRRTVTSVPRGTLLPEAPDFDGDGLRELVLNQSREGGISDTLRSFEWAGSGFAPADTLIATLFPKDVGDTNQDGLQELLLQVRGATLLLEQASPGAFPTELAFADTTGISNQSGEPLNGAQITDLDTDGRGEVLGTNGETWRAIERTSSGFDEVLRLGNPTSLAGRDSALANAFDTPEALSRDFDGDGQMDLLVGDRDGDLVVYEEVTNDSMEVVWTDETDRVDAGNRFGSGDVTGDGRPEFVTMRTYFRKELDGGEFEPKISYYSVWRSTGDDTYVQDLRLPIAGPFVDRGSITTADFDGDGRDEVAIAHPPSLLVLDRDSQGEWTVLLEHREQPSIQSEKLVAADFNGNGRPSLVAETAGDHLVQFTVDAGALAVAPPRWISARPTGASSVRLDWRAPGADSVGVYAGPPGEQLNLVAVTTDSMRTLGGTSPRTFALRAWENGTMSPLSPVRTLRPHDPGRLSALTYPNPSAVRLQFSEPVSRDARAEQFVLGTDASHPTRLLHTNNGNAVELRFSGDVSGRTFQLRWGGVRDSSGLLLGDTSATVSFPTPSDRSLYIQESEILSERRLRITFSEPLQPSAARERDRYKVRPRGRVRTVDVDADSAKTVTLHLTGLVIGASGEEASLTVTEMMSASGQRLAKEGRTIRLTRPADDLSNVFVYPNPYRASTHGQSLTIAGLPRTATVRIYTPDGRLVRVLSVDDERDGGTEWNLRDRRGERVPSGVYLFRVNAPQQSPVLKKAGIIR